VNDHTGIRQNRLYLSGGDGWSSLTYNAHHDAANTKWIFPDPARKAITLEMDDYGGATRFEVYSNRNAAPAWTSHFRITGDNDTTVMAYSGGRVGIGTTSPSLSYMLDVVGLARFQSDVRLNDDLEVDGDVHVDDDVRIDGDLSVGGNPWTDSIFGWGSISDSNLKKDVEPLKDALSQILRLRGVTYAWREPEKHGGATGRQIGMLAQEVEAVFPQWVRTLPDGRKAVGFAGFEGLVVEALRELSARCERLEAQLAELKASRAEQKEKPNKPR
jgi:hypothetical protein